jgi:BspA type Leucine rich repeat region (6 copies)
MKTSLPLAIAMGLAISTVLAHGDDFTYITNNATLMITGYTGPGGDVNIPSEINGLPVTRIGGYAFYDYATIRSVQIPNGVTVIDNWAFYMCGNLVSLTLSESLIQIGTAAFSRCSSLTDLTLPTAVATIGSDAFAHCTNLSSVTIPMNVTNIGSGSFGDCRGLTGINVDPLNPLFTSVDGVLFNGSKTALLQFPSGRAGAYTVPTTATTIGPLAFSGCARLTNATLHEDINEIGRFAFYECQSLAALYFRGNSPKCDETSSLQPPNSLTVYYLPGSTGWSNTYARQPAAMWLFSSPIILAFGPSFGIQTNTFGFRISWATNSSVVVETSGNPAEPTWRPLTTNPLVDGWSYFSDAEWTNYPARFYRIRSL